MEMILAPAVRYLEETSCERHKVLLNHCVGFVEQKMTSWDKTDYYGCFCKILP